MYSSTRLVHDRGLYGLRGTALRTICEWTTPIARKKIRVIGAVLMQTAGVSDGLFDLYRLLYSTEYLCADSSQIDFFNLIIWLNTDI